MPKLQMSPPWLAGITSDRDAEYIDAVQPGLVLRIRRGRMVWFVRYLFDGSARRYRIGEHPAVGLSAARKLASVVLRLWKKGELWDPTKLTMQAT